jgi:hypothetical protein
MPPKLGRSLSFAEYEQKNPLPGTVVQQRDESLIIDLRLFYFNARRWTKAILKLAEM